MSTAKKKRLGRGLDALLGNLTDASGEQRDVELRDLPIELLERGRYQPRTHMNKAALEELAQSIKAQGVLQPVVVRPLTGESYEIIAGERRWRAAQLAGLESVPVVIRSIPDDAALAIALIENIQRENLNPVEEANGLQRLLDEFGLTHQQVADTIGRSRTAVTNLLRLLTLNPLSKKLLEEEKLEMGHARALLALSGTDQDQAAKQVAAKGLSVRQTEALVRRWQQRRHARKPTANKPSADITRLQQQLSDRLAAKVSIKDRGGKGQVVIQYHSLEQLDGILDRFK
jgi:ParB family chromosome partitioning protein